MKNISNFLFKGLLVIVLFTSTSIVLNTEGLNTIYQAHATVCQGDVEKYLSALNYEVYNLAPVQGTEDWVGHTFIDGTHFITTVHIVDDQIIDHEDIPM